MPRLLVIIGSTRPGRVGIHVGTWFADRARAHGAFDVEVADLADIDLPLFDEPIHPRRRDYRHEHTRRWSETVEAADAFAFITPEYNFAMPSTLKNALDYLYHEWGYRPATVVSYGGVSAGLRAAQQLRQVLQALNMPAVNPSVSIPFVSRLMQDGELQPNEIMDSSTGAVLDELARWEQALRGLRGRG